MRRFDAIVQNTTHNWRAHITNLLSREYLELIRAHLNEGGVYWSNSTHSEAFQKTAAMTFPYARRFRSFVAVSDSPIGAPPALAEQRLLAWTIDGRAAFDPESPASLARIKEILGPESWRNATPFSPAPPPPV